MSGEAAGSGIREAEGSHSRESSGGREEAAGGRRSGGLGVAVWCRGKIRGVEEFILYLGFVKI